MKDQIEMRMMEEAISQEQHNDESTPTRNVSPDELLAAMPKEIRDLALAKLRDPRLIRHVVGDIAALGVAGEQENSARIYLT